MSIYIASREQREILNTKRSLSNITYNDCEIALHTLALQAFENWKIGHSSIIVMPSAVDRTKFLAVVAEMGLQPLLLTLNILDSVNDHNLANVRKVCQQPEKKETLDFNESKFWFQKWNQKAIQFYIEKYQSSNDTKAWRTLLDEYLSLKPNHSAEMLHSGINADLFDFNNTEMDEIRGAISDALRIYQKDFEISEHLHMQHLLHKKVQTPDRLNDVTYQLFTFKELAEILRDKYFSYSKQLETNYLLKIHGNKDRLLRDIELLKSQLTHHLADSKKKGIFDIFSEEKKQTERNAKKILINWKELNASMANAGITSKREDKFIPQNIIELLDIYAEDVQKIHRVELKEKADYIKSINRFNTNIDLLSALENELFNLTNEINRAEMLQQKLEVNTLSFIKQIDFINNLVYQLELLLFKIDKNIHFYEWTSFLDGCSLKVKETLRVLKYLDPSEWLHAFETWFYFSLLTKDNVHLWSYNDLCLNNLVKYYDASEKYEIKTLISRHMDNVLTHVEKLKNSNPLLYATIKKDKKLSHPTIWKHLLCENNAFFSALHPIILTDSDDLNEIKQLPDQHLMIFNKANINSDILQMFKSIFSYFSNDEFSNLPDFTLNQHAMVMNKTLNQITISERLPMMKGLVDIMSSQIRIPEIFQMKDSCMVSYATSYVNDVLSQRLYHLGIKKIRQEGDLNKALIGALLDSEKHIYIITEDGMFDPENHASLLWQILSIQQMKKQGCEIINIDTSEMMEQQEEILTPIIDLIHDNHQRTTLKEKNQIELELNPS